MGKIIDSLRCVAMEYMRRRHPRCSGSGIAACCASRWLLMDMAAEQINLVRHGGGRVTNGCGVGVCEAAASLLDVAAAK
jgi:hypothetical protein